MLDDDLLQKAINEPVRISAYDPLWPKKFDDEKSRLLALFSGKFLAIEHIGSTAVPLLPAKPIIDLMGGLHDIAQADALLPLLCENGYTTSVEFNATLGNRRWLMRHADGRRTHHLHLMIFQGEEWHRRLKFRDVLRANSEIARQYCELKENLAEAMRSDREAYSAAKGRFIENVLEQVALGHIQLQAFKHHHK